MPLGGGDIGANVWVEKGDLYFYFAIGGHVEVVKKYWKYAEANIKNLNGLAINA